MTQRYTSKDLETLSAEVVLAQHWIGEAHTCLARANNSTQRLKQLIDDNPPLGADFFSEGDTDLRKPFLEVVRRTGFVKDLSGVLLRDYTACCLGDLKGAEAVLSEAQQRAANPPQITLDDGAQPPPPPASPAS